MPDSNSPHLEAAIATGPTRVLLAGIFAAALLVRVVVYLEVSDTPLFEVLLGDSRGYVDWASRITAGDWLGDDVFYQAPLYPYFLALISTLLGPSRDAIAVVQSLLGAGACVFLSLATARFFSPRAGAVAGLLLAFYPSAIFFDIIVQKASVSTFLTTCLLWSLSRLDQPQRLSRPVYTGIVLGAMILTRENTLALLPCIALWLLLPWSGGLPRVRAARVGLFLLGVAMVLGPIGIRNWAFGDEFLITTSQLGTNLYIGNGSEAHGRYRPLIPNRGFVEHERTDAHRLAEEATGRHLSPGEVSTYWVRRTVNEISNEPGKWLRLMVHKSHLVLSAEEVPDTESIEAYADESVLLSSLMLVSHFGILLPLACLGAWLTRPQWRTTLPLLLITAATLASVVAFYVMSRYRFPVVPVLIVFAGAGVATAAETARTRRAKAWIGAFVVVLLSALVSNIPTGVLHQPRAVTHFNVGMMLFSQNRYPEAQHALERAARVSNASIIYWRLSETLEKREDYEAALRVCEEMLIRRLDDPVRIRRRIQSIRKRTRSSSN